ncbi:MAG TPA: ABC transporter permease [Bryobacteraceae bacterium]|nr:ABC transporter permease [Bryobacteraceae bacterium]
MSCWRQFTRGLRVLGNRKKADQEIADEVNHYLEEATAALVARGLTPDEARRATRLELGGTTSVREQVRGYGWENAISLLFADLRYAARGLAANPGFTAVSIVTLALGIGASTAIFSVEDAVLLRALPYPNPQKIVRIWEQAPNGHRMNLADLNFEDFRTQNSTFASLAAYEYWLSSVSGGSEPLLNRAQPHKAPARYPVRVNIAAVSSGFFKALGVEPFRGRLFAAEEQRPHGAPAAIVSHGYWQRYLGGATDLSKFRLRMEGTVYPVVGVMPESFDFPPGVAAWIPRKFDPDLSRTGHNWRGIGRIRDGVTVAQARADLSTIARRLRNQYRKDVDLNDVAVVPLADAIVGDMRTALLTLLGAVALLLLVACANVAGLLVARTSGRRKELAVRAALGAGRARLIQQFLAESFVLSSAGGVLGILIATWAVRALPAILPTNLPRQQDIAINAPVLLFAVAIIVAVTVSLGLFAAWRAATGDLQEALTAGSRSYSGTGASQRLRGFVVMGEIATTLVILIGAGLLGRSFLRLIDTSPGFPQQNLITMEFSPPALQWQADQSAIVRQAHQMDSIVARLRVIPGVESVGLAGALPVAAGDNLAEGNFLILNGQKPPAGIDDWNRMSRNPSQVGHALYGVASEGYFRTMGIPLIRGRLFGEQDDWNSPNVALITEALARRRWPNQYPIGQVIYFGNMDGDSKPLTVVGIVGDVRARGLNLPPSSIIYVDYRQRGMKPNSSPTILMRSATPVAEIVPAARDIFRDLAPDIPVKFSTFADEMGGWLADRRFLLLMVGLFAAAALALAAIGIYGVVAFSVTRRVQEIGIRMALGAQRGQVVRQIVGEGARLAAIGVAIGIAAALAVTRLLSSLLFGISATDLTTFVGVAVLLSVVALLASYMPARRAMSLDPNTALRHE